MAHQVESTGFWNLNWFSRTIKVRKSGFQSWIVFKKSVDLKKKLQYFVNAKSTLSFILPFFVAHVNKIKVCINSEHLQYSETFFTKNFQTTNSIWFVFNFLCDSGTLDYTLQGRKWRVGNCPPSFWQNRKHRRAAAAVRHITTCPASFR